MTKLFINLIEFLLSIIKVILPFWFQPPYDFHSKALNNDQVYSCKSSMMILYNVGDKTYYNIHIILIPSYDFHYFFLNFKRAALFLWNKFFLKSNCIFSRLKTSLHVSSFAFNIYGFSDFPFTGCNFLYTQTFNTPFFLFEILLLPCRMYLFWWKIYTSFFSLMTQYFCVKLCHLLCHSRQEYNKFVIDGKKSGKYLW